MTRAVREAVGAAYEQWDGKGWPGVLSGDDVPVAARIAQVAEFVEVAHRGWWRQRRQSTRGQPARQAAAVVSAVHPRRVVRTVERGPFGHRLVTEAPILDEGDVMTRLNQLDANPTTAQATG